MESQNQQNETNGTTRLQLSGQPEDGAPGRFEVLAITAGNGNGWQFSEETLRASLGLWEGAEVFIDHAWGTHSVRDLGGVVYQPEWDAEQHGIRMHLKACGPSGDLLEATGRDWLAAPLEQRARIGFSADIHFTARGREVQQILRVNSLDLVFNPARGGAFLRALNQSNQPTFIYSSGGKMMKEIESEMSKPGGTLNTQLQADQAAVQTLLNVQKEQQNLAEEAEKARAIRTQMCAYLLESGLGASRLPTVMSDHLRKQFSGQIFEPEVLTQAIEEARQLAASLQGGSVIQGARRQIEGMLTSEERLQAAVDDLLGAPRDKGMEGKRVESLHGIRELYMTMTGDFDLHGGYHSERVQLATTATMAGLVKNALNKVLVNQWEELGRAGYRWWEKIVNVEHFTTLNDITGVLVGEVGLLPAVSEGAAYGPLNIEDSPESAVFTKYGGYLPLTLELIDRDDVTRLKAYPKKLANSSLRRISAMVSAVFTSNEHCGPIMTDGANLFDAARHSNLGTAALDSTSWETASTAIYNQNMLVYAGDTAPRLAVDARYLVVPRSLRLKAMQILYPNWERAASIFSENLQKGELGDVVTCPEWTDGNNWAAIADPKIAPGIILGERFGLKPEIFIAGDEYSPAMFTNDEVRLKIRHFLAVLVADHRPMYKANAAE